MLTTAQVDAYRRDGYVTPFRAVDAARAERWHQDVRRCCAEAARANSGAGLRQPSTRVKPYLLFPGRRRSSATAILNAVEDLIGPDILVFHTTMWWKTKGSPSRVPWHQDGTYFGLAPHEHVTAWVALSPSNTQTGCVGSCLARTTLDSLRIPIIAIPR